MNDKSGFAAVSRRDAIRLIAATPASGAVFATSVPSAASANTTAAAAHATGPVAHGAAATQGVASQGMAGLAATHFEPLVGQTFLIGGDHVILTELRRGPASGERFREQFALTFSAPQHRTMPSEILPVSHPAIGRHDLHVTGLGGSGLEICFS
jgi:uncharacterized protein DUF6916